MCNDQLTKSFNLVNSIGDRSGSSTIYLFLINDLSNIANSGKIGLTNFTDDIHIILGEKLIESLIL